MRDVAYIALGSNVGHRDAFLAAARAALAELPDSRLIAASAIEETAPVGPVPQGPYLNQMVAVETSLAPHALLAALHCIEAKAGRKREAHWGPRTLDLDIVMFDTQTVDAPDLVVPHPALPARDFWQRELDILRSRDV